jgi:group I intron endonuclease
MATIYKITSEKGEKVYIGSTTQSLPERWGEHKCRNHNCTSKILFDEYGIDTCSLEEIEKVDHDKRYERERFWIENTENCVNIVVPGRTQAEWYQENKERVLEHNKAYRLENSDKIKARKTERITCPTCGKNLARNSFASHKKRHHLSKVETLPQME